ncbi:hypothetical protein JTB14_012775 [Gonioctena quinquepunctata]|nr:hypothetical protein JTB14_012775 [Gonioctena quinquepunctata]
MGFLDKYIQTRRSYSNIEVKNRPGSVEWNSVPQIIVEHDQENEIAELNTQSGSQENESVEIDSQSDGVSSFAESCSTQSV